MIWRMLLPLLAAFLSVATAPTVMAQPVPDEALPPTVHNAWRTTDGGSRLVLKNGSRGELSGYAVSSTGRKSWEVVGRVTPEGVLQLTRYVPKSEWGDASEVVKDEAIRQLGGSRKPGFIESPMSLTLGAEGKTLSGTYSLERIEHSGDRLVSVSRVEQTLSYVQITDLLEALLWTAIAAGVVAGLISMGIDFVPVVGDIKGFVEGLSGRDSFTGEELAAWERALGALPLIGAVGAVGAMARVARRAGPMMDLLGDMLKRVKNGERVLDKLSDALQRCFVAGTPVLMADGSTRAIKSLATGDEILALAGGADSVAGGAVAVRKVTAVHRREASALVRVSVAHEAGEAVVECTPRHPFATSDGYVPAGRLVAGTELLCRDGSRATVAAVESAPGPREVYNLTVEQDHCYFVTALGLLVHNVCPALSQRQFERALDEAADFRRVVDEAGNPLPREAAFKNNESLGFGPLDRMPDHEQAALYRQAKQRGIDVDGWYKDDFKDPAQARKIMDRLGYSDRAIDDAIASRNFERAQRDAKRAITDDWRKAVEGSTRADDLRYWKDPETGNTELVAFELKTPDDRAGSTVGDFIREKNQELAEQISQRSASLRSYDGQPVNHDLVIDLRNMKGATPDTAIAELRTMFEYNRNNPDPRNFNQAGNVAAVEDFYKRVRFVVDKDGVPTVTPPYVTRP